MQCGDVICWSDGNLQLSTDRIDVWCVESSAISDTHLINEYHDLLGANEKARHDRFRFVERKHQYSISQALLRTVLSLYAGNVSPKAWRFDSNKYGKPFILNDGYQNVKFNLSHTNELIVLSVVFQNDIGIDVEAVTRDKSSIDRVGRYFSEEEYQKLKSLPEAEQVSYFIDLWTLKEAYAKACGRGLSIPLNHSIFTFNDDDKINLTFHSDRKDDSNLWRFWQLRYTNSHQLALALKTNSEATEIELRKTIPLLQYEAMNIDVIRNSL